MLDIVFGILTAVITLIGAIAYGKRSAKKEIEKKLLEKETKIAKEVLDVKPSGDVSDALKRLSKNGKLRDRL